MPTLPQPKFADPLRELMAQIGEKTRWIAVLGFGERRSRLIEEREDLIRRRNALNQAAIEQETTPERLDYLHGVLAQAIDADEAHAERLAQDATEPGRDYME